MKKLGAAITMCVALAVVAGCSRAAKEAPTNEVGWGSSKKVGAANVPSVTGIPADAQGGYVAGAGFRGFDRNEYPGDATMASMTNTFAFVGYWLTNPPGESSDSWKGKRTTLRSQGWGFLLLADGRFDKEILEAGKRGISPAALAKDDAAIAEAAAKAEGFPAGAIVFLDQEEGGRLLDEQAAYLLAWTEAVAASAYKPGVYASGQPVADDANITTIDDVRARVKAQKLHDVAMFDAQDGCPPAAGCTLSSKPMNASGELNLTAWQYAQSPRRPEITKACGKTYASDGNCYAPGFGTVFLDMDVAATADPSHGR